MDAAVLGVHGGVCENLTQSYTVIWDVFARCVVERLLRLRQAYCFASDRRIFYCIN